MRLRPAMRSMSIPRLGCIKHDYLGNSTICFAHQLFVIGCCFITLNIDLSHVMWPPGGIGIDHGLLAALILVKGFVAQGIGIGIGH